MKRRLLRICVFLVLGAIVNVAVAWLAFPGTPGDWGVVVRENRIDTAALAAANGLPMFDHVDRDTLRTIGFLDRHYAAVFDPARNKYPMHYGRETRCGWPCLALYGASWSPIRFNEWTQTYEFEQKHMNIGSIHLSDDRILLGEREYLPIRPIWPGFAINTLFYAAVL